MPLLDNRSGPSYGTLDQMERRNEEERDQLLEGGYDECGNNSETESLDSVQEGVRKIEAINMTWTTRSLIVAYIRSVGGLFGSVNPSHVLT